MSKTAKFTEMTKGTAEDYVPIVEAAMVHTSELPQRILEHLEMLLKETDKEIPKFIEDQLLIINLNSKIDQGKMKIVKKIQMIPKGCCFGNPYLSPSHLELKYLSKCSPMIK